MGMQDKGFKAVGCILKQGCSPAEHLLLSLLDQGPNLEACRFVHYSMCISCPGSVCVSGPLIRSLASLHSLLDVNLVFCQVSNPTVHTWQAIIDAHLVNGKSVRAIEFYHCMVASGAQPNRFVFTCVLRACACLSDYLNGMLVHEHIITYGLHEDVILGSTLIDMYAKCGIMTSAMRVFELLRNRNIVSWNALINGYVLNEESHQALKIFQAVQVGAGTIPNKVTFLCAMKACADIEDPKQGLSVHGQLVIMGLDIDLNIANTLIDMYAKCHCMVEAFYVLHNMPIRTAVSWSAIITGAVHCGNRLLVLPLYDQMVREGIIPDRVILIGLLNACAYAKDIEHGSRIHEQILERGFGADLVVRGALIDMYAKCNMLNDAWRVFDKTPNKSLMLWGLMITGYAHHGEGSVALGLYEEMMDNNVKPDKFLFATLLNVCGNMGALEQGKTLHDQLSNCQVETDTVIGNTLIDMYSKCGDFEKACKVFDKLPYRDDVSWHVMLSSHTRQHCGKPAIWCFGGVQQYKMWPNEPFYTGLVSACRHDGSQSQFNTVTSADPGSMIMRLYTSVVEVLACVGHLEMATRILQTMPISPNAIHWRSLLSRCRGHGNLQLAQHCMDKIVRLFPINDLLLRDADMLDHPGMPKSGNVLKISCDRKDVDVSSCLSYDEFHALIAEFDLVKAMEQCRHPPKCDSYLKPLVENHTQLTSLKNPYLENCFYSYLTVKSPGDFLVQDVGNKMDHSR